MTKNHKTIDTAIHNAPWAITAGGLETVMAVARRDPDIQALAAKKHVAMEAARRVSVRGNVAIVPVTGPIFRYANFMTDLCGATSVAALATDFQASLDNPEIDSIILTFDSPGGMAAGINEMSDLIYVAREQKTVVAYVGEQAASAAYWMASAADRIVVDETASLGSIGVVIGYRKSGDDDRVEIVSTASPKKRLDPDSDEGKADLLARADDLASVFIEKVARNRGIEAEKVLSDFGQGGELIGTLAVTAGMADEIGSLENLITELQTQKRGKFMDITTFKADHPALYEQVKAEGAVAGKESATGLAESAVSAEKERILGLAESVFGAEASEKFTAVVNSGVSVEQMTALSGVFSQTASAEDDSKKKILEALQAATPPPVNGAVTQQANGGDGDFVVMVKLEMKESGVSRSAAIKTIRKDNPAAYDKWLTNQQGGR